VVTIAGAETPGRIGSTDCRLSRTATVFGCDRLPVKKNPLQSCIGKDWKKKLMLEDKGLRQKLVRFGARIFSG